MATNNAAAFSAQTVPGANGFKIRRTTVLAAHAHAMLSAGPAFWRCLPAHEPQRRALELALADLRMAEDQFYCHLSDRLKLMVLRQRIDRECWDLLATARELLKPILGREWSEEWGRLGFVDGSLRIPSDPGGRVRALKALIEHLGTPTHHGGPDWDALLADMKRLSQEVDGVMMEAGQIRSHLCRAAMKTRKSSTSLELKVNHLRETFQLALRAHDPRWIAHAHPHEISRTTGGCGTCEVALPESCHGIVDGPMARFARSGSSGQPANCHSRRKSSGAGKPTKKEGEDPHQDPLATLSISAAIAWLVPVF
jgi:hypothetical protein